MKKVRIVLIEDNRLLREGIALMVKKQSDMHIVASVSKCENLLQMMEKHKPDITLLDISLSSLSSLDVVKIIKKSFPETRIIAINLIPLQTDVLEFIQAGVSGFILEDVNATEFFKTIRSIYKGNHVLPPHLTGSLFSQIVEQAVNGFNPSAVVGAVHLSKRESQVIGLVADGFTNKEIAQKLNLSTYTVKSHVHSILEKLSIHTRAQIVKYLHAFESDKPELDTLSIIKE